MPPYGPLTRPSLTPRLAAAHSLLLPQAEPIWDIGCEHGQLLHQLRSEGRSAWGIEVAPHLARHSQQQVGAVVIVGDGPRPIGRAGQVVICGLGSAQLVAMASALRPLCTAEPGSIALQRLIICPSDVPFSLRDQLATLGWVSVAERLSQERGRMHVALALAPCPAFTSDAPCFPLGLALAKDPLYPKYLEYLQQKTRKQAHASTLLPPDRQRFMQALAVAWAEVFSPSRRSP